MRMDWKADYIPLKSSDENEENNQKKRVLTTTSARTLSLRLKLTHLRVKLDDERSQSKDLKAKNEELAKKVEELQADKNNLLHKVNIALAMQAGADEAVSHLTARLERVQAQRLQEKITAHGSLSRFTALVEQLKSRNLLEQINFDEISSL